MTRHSLRVFALLSGVALGGFGAVDRAAAAPSEPATTVAVAARSAPFTKLRPPVSSIRRSLPGQAPGLIFVTPKSVFGAKPTPEDRTGAEILDARGAVRYFRPNRGGDVATDFRVQRYRGKPVLTYWYGRQIFGSGQGYGVILDQHYRRIATVRAGNGLRMDLHEFRLTDRGTALLGAYRTTMSGEQKTVEGVVQEVEVASGRVVTEWHSLPDVDLSESYLPRGSRSVDAYEYFHFNSIAEDDDGNLLVSARHTWAMYKIERGTGKLLWKLGGKDSDFAMGPGAQTAWQHDFESEGKGVYRIFDNRSGDVLGRSLGPKSRVLRLKLDTDARTATVVSARTHPAGISAGTQGNTEALGNGDTFVGYGSQGVFSEFAPDGRLRFDARLPRGLDTYRAFKSAWKGVPREPPHVSSRRRGTGLIVGASWNGGTEVRSWRVRTGRTADALRTAGSGRWTNLETRLLVPAGTARYVAVQALDARGRVLASSRTRRVGR